MKLKRAKQDLDHHVWKLLKTHSLNTKKILVALSGGTDSVALLRVLSKIHKKDLLGACYFHHGEDVNQEYRKEAQVFCEKLCAKLGVEFFPLKSSSLAKSEAEYRELRYEALERLMREQEFQILATGHHRDDLLETRLLRLIRGTGAQGFQAMHVLKDAKFRPFLEVTKRDLKKYLREEKLRIFEDPSNDSLDPLRNWIREEWLKALEKRSRGASAALARSLETIALEIENRPWGDLLSQNEAYKTQGLSRGFYLTLSPFEQKRLLAQYLFALEKKDFSQSHLEEIQKRLDKSQKVITFKVGGCHWEVNAQQIKVQS
ncbi:MAG: tRNA(Ile)-lysidine synthase [Bdellovibrio sp. ArHS]|uniref:tRNA lysidine(34) synthetase TilS n=1 Tax=Bdellovibrio sp. ArHS TaxID=1569284 RepID=UPI00058316BF|nr:tRNA lysidine(34) synthetase TilS [Bdellovibrio sp. ArHS]KHD87964.1 MAG: tRNA(Ile)-lysidine synthase [Bdellovibrio sp. ArHS]